jgi:hypothetical protein
VASPELPKKKLKVLNTIEAFREIWGMEPVHEPKPWWAKVKEIPPSPPSPPRLLSDKARQEMREVLLLCECEDEPEEEEREEKPLPPIILDGNMLPITSQIEVSHPLVPPIA